MPMDTTAGRTVINGLHVATVLERFVDDEVLAGTSVTPDRFWSGLAEVVEQLGRRVVAAGIPAQLRGTTDRELGLELWLHPGGTDPSLDAAPDGVAVARRVRNGRRVLLTIPADDATGAVAWADALHRADRIDGYALSPVTLEDSYLAATSPPPTTHDLAADLTASTTPKLIDG